MDYFNYFKNLKKYKGVKDLVSYFIMNKQQKFFLPEQ